MIKKSIYLLFAVLGAGLFAACDENIHDFTKKTGSEAANDVYITDVIFNFPLNRTVDAEVTGVDSVFAKFPVYSALAAENNISVKLSVDNELVKVYNTVHGTAYNSISPDSMNLKTTTLTIPKGQTQSSDSITIAYKGKLQFLTDTKGYLIPVRIESYSGMDVKINYESRVGYLFINVTQENGIYFKTQENSGKITNNPALNIFNDLEMEFKLYSLFETKNDAKINLSVNNSLIADYNSRMGTDYQAVPQGDFSPVEINFPKGSTEATGALVYKGDIKTLTNNKGYVIPFEITSVTGADIRAAKAQKVFYAIVDISNRSCQSVDDDSALGTKITDRTGYTVTRFVDATGAEVTPTNGNTKNNMFTNSNTEFWLVQKTGVQLNITIDMGKDVRNITGLLLEGYQASASFNMKSVDVLGATQQMYANGQDVMVGKISLATGKQMLYIQFNEPVDARYIKLNNMTPVSQILALRQFYIYTK